MKNRSTALGLAGLAAAVLGPAPASAQACSFEETKVVASNGAAGDLFGQSVAVDGPLALVGAFLADRAGTDSGTVYVVDAATGQPLLEIAPADGASFDYFGRFLDLCGTTAIVGAYGDDPWGSAYVLDATTGQVTWKLQPDPVFSAFGWSVAIDGTTAVVGASADETNGPYAGAAYVFDVTSGQRTAKLLASDGALFDYFGWAVAVSGTTILVGADRANAFGPASGAVYVFDAVTGLETGKLFSAGAGPYFGGAVDLDGTTALIGTNCGNRAFLYDLTTLLMTAELLPLGPGSGCFGDTVSLGGGTAVVGFRGADPWGSSSGTAWVFDATTGQPLAELLAADGAAGDFFGLAVATDGARVLVGSRTDEVAGADAGSVYLFDPVEAPTAYCTAKPNTLGCATAVDWLGLPDLGQVALFDVRALDVINQKSGLLFYGTTGAAAIPFLGGVLCAAPPLQRTPPQSSGGSPPPAADCSGSFSFDFNAWAQSGVDPSLVAGVTVFAQYWWRDPAQPDGTGVALTNAVEFGLCP